MKHSLIVAALVLPLTLLTASSHAQFGGRSAMMQAADPDIWARDLPIFVESLQLEEWQRPIMEMLVEDYLANFKAGFDAVKQRMQNVQVKGEKVSVETILQPLEEWGSQKKQLYADFLQGVRSQLSEQQLERWPSLERALRRERMLPQAELSGEGINLIAVLKDLAPPPEVMLAAQPALEAYEIRLDQGLMARQAQMESLVPALKEAMASMNHERGIQLQERVMATRIALRDAQDQSVEEIAAALGADWGPRFRDLAMQRAYAEAFTPSPVMRQYVAALALTDLTDEQRTTITGLKAEFQTALDQLSQQTLVAMKTQEPGEMRRKAERLRERREGTATPAREAPSPGSMEAVRASRTEINEKYRKLLEEALKPEQYQSLPGAGKLSIKPRTDKPKMDSAGPISNPAGNRQARGLEAAGADRSAAVREKLRGGGASDLAPSGSSGTGGAAPGGRERSR